MPVVEDCALEVWLSLAEEMQQACQTDQIAAVFLRRLKTSAANLKGRQLDLPPASFSFARSLSEKSLRSFNLLPGRFPLSIIAANFVALLIRSGKLVRLPLASASLTASISSFGGRRIADNRLKLRSSSFSSVA